MALLSSFFDTDRIFDFLLPIEVRPVVELSFMPRVATQSVNLIRLEWEAVP